MKNWGYLIGIILGGLVMLLRLRAQRWMSRLRMREQALIIGAWLAFCGVLFWVSHLWYEWYTEPAPAPYATMEEAAADGCVVINAPGILEDGEERWEQFFFRTGKGLPDYLRIAIWDGGEAQNVNELLFDGTQYHYTITPRLKHRDKTTVTYPYLLLVRYEPPEEENALYLWRETYVLTDKADLTGEEYAKMLLYPERDFQAHGLIMETQWRPEYAMNIVG